MTSEAADLRTRPEEGCASPINLFRKYGFASISQDSDAAVTAYKPITSFAIGLCNSQRQVMAVLRTTDNPAAPAIAADEMALQRAKLLKGLSI